mmetsp:Transcript_17408/g.34199  ORF Transcript_17408/g.34199 Transcript_17408/m.34199 type:complete len:267 (+) Transcript_17408:711-1511(+)
MDRTRKVVRKQKVKHRAPANKVYHSRGEDNLDDSVGHKPTVQWQRVHHHGAESVGPDLVELPEPLTRSGGAEPDLKVRGKILIKLGSLVLVVKVVVLLESNKEGEDKREVGKHTEPAVSVESLKGKVVTDLMSRQKKCLGHNGAKEIRNEPEFKSSAVESLLAKVVTHSTLHSHENHDNVLRERLIALELVDLLAKLFDHLLSSEAVRFRSQSPQRVLKIRSRVQTMVTVNDIIVRCLLTRKRRRLAVLAAVDHDIVVISSVILRF